MDLKLDLEELGDSFDHINGFAGPRLDSAKALQKELKAETKRLDKDAARLARQAASIEAKIYKLKQS